MLVLLGISTGIAIVTPAPRDDPPAEETPPPDGTTGATGATGSPEDQEPPGENTVVVAEVDDPKKTEDVRAAPGDRLVLTVDPGRPADVEIPGLGLAGTATEFAPVVFDVRLPPRAASYEVIELPGRKLARIEIGGD